MRKNIYYIGIGIASIMLVVIITLLIRGFLQKRSEQRQVNPPTIEQPAKKETPKPIAKKPNKVSTTIPKSVTSKKSVALGKGTSSETNRSARQVISATSSKVITTTSNITEKDK